MDWNPMNILPARLFISFLALAAVSAFGANRTMAVTAPADAKAGSTVHVVIAAATDAGEGEQVGFLHAEYSTDGGKTWTGFCGLAKAGPAVSRSIDFPVGAEGSKAIVRVRAAFRDGKAGDVDFKGGKIDWDESWAKWLTPPSKFAVIYVK